MMHTSLIKIADNLTDEQHPENFKQIAALNLDGIEISEVGSRWGATWNAGENYDLKFLRFYKGIKSLRLQLHSTKNIESILELADGLQYLHLGHFSTKRMDLGFLGRLKDLKFLSVCKQTKGLESIISLKNLGELSLFGYPIEKMDFLNELQTLECLYIGFGTSTDINTINRLYNLKELDILWIKRLSDITAISNLSSLVKLKIEDERQISSIPNLSKLTNLKNIRLMNLSSLQDISSLNQSLVEEFIWTGPNKNADILASIENADNLKRVYTFLYTKRQQQKAEQILNTKFSSLDSMKFEMDNRVSLHYYDLKGQLIK